MRREWVPISSSTRGRLVVAGLLLFGAERSDLVGVGEIASKAGVTTGALYHHFGSKQGLYDIVRRDVDRRLLDRMQGAISTSPLDRQAQATAALLAGFDFAVAESFFHLLVDPPGQGQVDLPADLLGSVTSFGAPGGAVLVAALRGALRSVIGGVPAPAAREVLGRLRMQDP